MGLLSQNILSEDEVKQLIPDVLDSLLDFHLGLLRRLKQRKTESVAVETISDIVIDEVLAVPETVFKTPRCLVRDR